MSYNKLEQNLTDLILEEQAKLGYKKERIRLYYPLSSLNHILHAAFDSEEMERHLLAFPEQVKDRLGLVDISRSGDRFCFSIPEEGTEYVHEHQSESPFISELVQTVSRHGCTMQEILEVFRRYSPAVHAESVSHGEFDYLVYFEDGRPDGYLYCFALEPGHIIYHRFLPEDYRDFGFL